MRRLIRRAMVKAFDLGVEQNFLEQIVPVIADLYCEDFPEVAVQRDYIIATLVKEEKAFRQLLSKACSVPRAALILAARSILPPSPRSRFKIRIYTLTRLLDGKSSGSTA